jgi:hypothetical protein
MSIKVMSWVWEYSMVGAEDILVLLAIADAANDDGRNAFPGIEKLARKCRCSERTVQRAIDRLVKAGELDKEDHGGGTANVPTRHRPNNYAVLRYIEAHNPAIRQVVTPQTSRGDKTPDSEVTTSIPPLEPPYKEEPSIEPSTSASASDTVVGGNGSSGQSPNGRTKAGTPRKVSPACQALTREIWDALDPKPLCRFVGLQGMLAECLGAGYTEHALRAVAPHVVAWSRNGITMAMHMAKIDPKAGSPAKRYYTDPADYGL